MSEIFFRRASRSIFIAGAILRIAVFASLNGVNHDDHFSYIEYIRLHHAIPRADQMNMGFHAPLYYLLAIPFDCLDGINGVQFFSLLLSLAGLVLIWRLLDDELIPDRFARLMCRAFAAFFAQYIVASLYISNDSLAFVAGTLLAIAIVRLIRHPTTGRWIWVTLAEAMGLLTKGTFLAYLPVVAVSVYFAWPGSRLRKCSAAMSCLVLAFVLGGYKFAQNDYYFGRPFIQNLDFNPPWAAIQRPTYVGISSLLDINILKLIARPVGVSTTLHSYWLPFYATFWYQQQIVSNYQAALHGWWWIGSVTFIFAIVPTLLMAMGLVGLIRDHPVDPAERSRIFQCRALAALPSINFLLVLWMLVRYDMQSVPHSRLLFPALAGIILLLARGWMMLPRDRPHLKQCAAIAVYATVLMNVAFLVVEILFHFGALPTLPINLPLL